MRRADLIEATETAKELSGITGPVCFVHARSGSERIKGKALVDVGGYPLIAWAIAAAKGADVGPVVIDSDDSEILDAGWVCGAIPVKRPAGLAGSDVTGDDLAAYQAKLAGDSSILVQVVPTCPFTKSETILKAVEIVHSSTRASAVAVIELKQYEWENGRPAYMRRRLPGPEDDRVPEYVPNSQEMEPRIIETTGLYVIQRAIAAVTRRRMLVENVAGVRVTPIEAIDINDQDDLDLARAVAASGWVSLPKARRCKGC